MSQATNNDSHDLTGRKSFLRNVLFTWGGYGFNLAAGFILPRLVTEQLGQTALGIWDFAWSMVGYLGMIELGIGASVDRFLAGDRAAGDLSRLARNVSSMSVCMRVLGLLTLLGAALVAFLIVPLFRNKLGASTEACTWIVFFLGLSAAFEVFMSVYWSAIVASHRWDLHNTIAAIVSGVSTLGMVIAVSLGGGLIAMAAIHSTSSIAGHIVRWRLAYKVCPELHIDWRLAKLRVVLEQTHFAAKNLLPRLAEMLVNQSTSLLLTAFVGPAALAVFARPRSLTKHVRTLVGKFSAILIPSASALQARDDHGALREMFLRRSEQAGCLSVPALLWLAILGGPFISLWMGREYFHPWLVPVMSLGYLASLMQDPVWAIMSGLNKHGRIAIAKLIGACFCAAGVGLALAFTENKLLGAAIALTVPMLFVDGIIVPSIACRSLGVPLADFYRVTLWKPFLVFVPSGACLIAARLLFPRDSNTALAVGACVGGVVFAATFYLMVVPARIRASVRGRLNGMLSRA
jgi:O-antigen/teichoic acid export membrane protein